MKQKDHISKACHNEDFWNTLHKEKSKFLDWTVAGIFYSAMHYIDAFFHKGGKHLKSHEIADREISQNKQLNGIYTEYRTLKDYRWKASYWSTRFSKEEIDQKVIPHFRNIKSLVLRLLSE